MKKAKEQLKQVRARRDYWKELAQAPASARPAAAPKTAPCGRGRQAKPR
ncbi:MAG: hypothetical protein IT427_08320 [Pirellulales bacterium]|nr:hypothetical protein [Pirellulales bacterium]